MLCVRQSTLTVKLRHVIMNEAIALYAASYTEAVRDPVKLHQPMLVFNVTPPYLHNCCPRIVFCTAVHRRASFTETLSLLSRIWNSHTI